MLSSYNRIDTLSIRKKNTIWNIIWTRFDDRKIEDSEGSFKETARIDFEPEDIVYERFSIGDYCSPTVYGVCRRDVLLAHLGLQRK